MTNDRVGPCARAYTTTSDDDCRRYQGVFGPPEYYTQHDIIYRGRRRGKAHRCTQLQQNLIHGEKHQQQKKQDAAAAAAADDDDDDDDDNDDDDCDCACR